METMTLVWIIGFLDFCMELFDEEETINSFLLMNLGLKEPYLVLIRLEKRAHRPTHQAQRRGAPHAISRPLGASARRRPGPLGPKGRYRIIWRAHIPQVRLKFANEENKIIPNNILSCQST